jgi:hypothetical protein
MTQYLDVFHMFQTVSKILKGVRFEVNKSHEESLYLLSILFVATRLQQMFLNKQTWKLCRCIYRACGICDTSLRLGFSRHSPTFKHILRKQMD